MLQVTDRAIDKFREMREQSGLQSDQLIALTWKDGELRSNVAAPSPEDRVIEKDGEPVVCVPPALSQALDGAVLDYDDSPENRHFTLDQA
jgi:Fe-S cluster assembly iron-binding protein IscA